MHGSREEIMRLLEDLRRLVAFDSYHLSRTQQDRAELEIQRMKEFFDGLYSGK